MQTIQIIFSTPAIDLMHLQGIGLEGLAKARTVPNLSSAHFEINQVDAHFFVKGVQYCILEHWQAFKISW